MKSVNSFGTVTGGEYGSAISLNRRTGLAADDMFRRNSANLKTFSPLRQSISLSQQGRRNSVALRQDARESPLLKAGDVKASVPEAEDEVTAALSEEKPNCFKRFTKSLSKRCKCRHYFLTKYHPRPQDDAPCYTKLCYALRLPPHSFIGRLLTGGIALGFVYLLLLLIFSSGALPHLCESIYETIEPTNTSNLTPSPIITNNQSDGNDTNQFSKPLEETCKGSLFAVFIVLMCSLISGTILRYCHLPPMLGMIVTGVLLRNIPGIEEASSIDKVWFSSVRNIALSVILARAGLCMDPDTLKRLSAAVFRLAFVPCVTEACVDALAAYVILGFPVEWGFMLGFVLGAVSPAVVVLSMLKLEQQGYGVNKGIPTLVIAAASMDDVLAITGFSFCTGFAFSKKNDIVKKLVMGPTEALCGLIYGIVGGWLMWYLPNRKNKKLVIYRSLFLIGGGIVAIMGSSALHFEAAGAIGCLTLAFMAGYGWRKRDGWNEEHNPIIPVVDTLWWIAEPLLFGLIGVGVDFKKIKMDKLGMGLGVVAIGLIFRMLSSFLVVMRIGLTMREKLFIPFAWLPKATVQAAIGPIALDFALRQSNILESHVDFGQQILAIAAIVILITAPLGALSIAFLGPKMLTKDEVDMSVEGSVNQELNQNTDGNESDDSLSMQLGPLDTDFPIRIINSRARGGRKLSWQDDRRHSSRSTASQMDGQIIGMEGSARGSVILPPVTRPSIGPSPLTTTDICKVNGTRPSLT